MTPDAVIYRYLQLISPHARETDALCALVALDADLSRGWLQALQLPASPSRLREHLRQLPSAQISSLAQAQLAAVAPNGSARLSIEQWTSVLRAACLAEVLFVTLNDGVAQGSAEAVRTRALLALSGAQLPHDERLCELVDYRGVQARLLEDAELELRVFAVADALELGTEADLAESLLGVDEHQLRECLAEADHRVAQHIADLQISLAQDVDWAERIWLYQQISIVSGAFADCSGDTETLHQVHASVSRCIFRRPPLILLGAPGADHLQALALPNVRVALASQTSHVAAAGRTLSGQHCGNTAEDAVVDRQLLREMNADQGYAFGIAAGARTLVFLADADEDLDVESALALYAQAFASRIIADDAEDADEAGDDAQDVLQALRDEASQRLREIVHEANNPLSIVHNYLHILELRLQHDPQLVEQLQMVGSELRRAGEVFARAREVPEQLVLAVDETVPDTPSGEVADGDLGAWIPDTVELHRGLARNAGVALQGEWPVEAVPLRTQWNALQQVLSNLIKNAIEACREGDDVSVRVLANVYRGAQAGVVISVSDTGPGLASDVLDHLWEDKASTKPEGQGLGLKLVYQLVQQLGGAIDYRSNVPHGAQFDVFLPVAD